jgi:hyaluronoglucosaminidase
MSRPDVAVRGVLEGFYGVYYTFPERNDLIRFSAAHGFNYYLYAPKNDRQHRMRWREPYPDYIMEQFADTVRIAESHGVTFCYSIGSGVSMSYASQEDFERIATKLKAFYHIGVRAFNITLDDIASDFKHEADRERYGSFAEAHADVCNRLYAWLTELDPRNTLSLCPTDYHGTAPFSAYLHELGEKLQPEVDIMYTGPDICSTEIAAAHADTFAEAARRKPILWDNYPVNDLDMKSRLHIGPIRGRDAALPDRVKGVVVNTMVQAEASKIPLLTYADYLDDPAGYDPTASWKRALQRVGGERSVEALTRFAENSLFSCLKWPEAEKLQGLTDDAMNSLRRGDPANGNAALERLDAYVSSLDEACYHLKNRLENLALRNNLLPWTELLEHWHWMTKRAIAVLQAMEKGEAYEAPLRMMKESFEEAGKHPKRIAGRILVPLAEFVIERVESTSGEYEGSSHS